MSRRGKWLLAAALAVLVVGLLSVVAGLLLARATPAPATPAALEISTARTVGAPFESRCSGSDEFECQVYDESGSGTSPYRVLVDENDCWRATLNGPQGGEKIMPETLNECVTRYDHIVARFPSLLVLGL